jgi:hypothetical protein
MVYKNKQLRLAIGATMANVTTIDLVVYFGAKPAEEIVKRLAKEESVTVPRLHGTFKVEPFVGNSFRITRVK